MERVRLSGKELFVYYHKGMGDIEAGGCTNKRILAEKSGIGYNNLVRIFTRNRVNYYEDDTVVIIRLYVRSIVKGSQSMARRGKGGMERFRERYMMKRREY